MIPRCVNTFSSAPPSDSSSKRNDKALDVRRLRTTNLNLATIDRGLMCNNIAVFTASILLLLPSGAKATMRRASAGNKFIAYIKYKSRAKRLIRSFLKPKQLQIFGRKNIERGDWLIPRKNSIAENPLECRNGWSSNVIFMKPGNLSRLASWQN
jgi:hypothetical protein